MIKPLIAIVLAAVWINSASAQYDPDKVNRKARALFEKAYTLAKESEYEKSIAALKESLKIDSNFLDAWLSIAGLYGEQKKYTEAITYYEKARSLDSAWFRDYNLPYSISLAGLGEFQKAMDAVNKFLSSPNLNAQSVKAGTYRKKTYQFAIDYASQHPMGNYQFKPQNLGDSINSEHLEYFPALTLDSKELIFTRRVNTNEDFFGSHMENGHWTKAQRLTGDINSNMNEGAQNISQDGQWLIFTGCNFPDGKGSCDLYISYRTPEGWSRPENLGSINTEAWESAPSLSPDKRDLYFTSSRLGGYGSNDIYVTHRLPNGRWSEPENLGPEVNTIGEEINPFIHADNQTLYFTSSGHLGYGGTDLFMVKKEPNNKWSKAINLGYPINTIENEGSLVIAADGKTAYYASDRSDSRGGLDLYSFELRDDIRPARTLWVKGKVFDKKSSKGLPSAIVLTDLGTREVLTKVQTDETGSYLITLPVGKDYAFNVNRKGYLFYSENFSLNQKTPDSTYNIDIPLQPIEANASVVLKNIFFDINKYDLKPESTVELDNLFELLRENASVKIEISGHTDNVGKASENMTLSNNRAQAVVKYLAGKGIDMQRLSFKGYGATKPIADNKTEEGRAQNRRTEVRIRES